MQTFASSYTDLASAQRSLDHLIARDKHQARIGAWIDTGCRHPLVLEGTIPGESVGIVISKDDIAAGRGSQNTNEAKVVLKAALQSVPCYTVHTTYPIVKLTPHDIDETYPSLFQLLGGYYHQDWSADYGGSPQTALEAYVAASTSSDRARTLAEVDQLLTVVHDEDVLRRLLLRFDNNYPYVEHADFTSRMWFETIATRIRME